jgi:hypothetical protein
MAMFTVYGDASGSDPALPILALGGFISTVQQWEEFCKQWPKVLASGSVSVYHAADLESRKGEFARWSEKKKLRFQILAYQTLARYVAAGVASVVVRADFEAHKIHWDKVPQGKPANHYIFCVHDFIKNVNNWAKAHGYTDTPINYIFERGDPGKGEVERIFYELAVDPSFNDRHLIGNVTFSPKRDKGDPRNNKKLQPLQAADIWAYESYKHMNDRILPMDSGQKPRAESRPGYQFLFKEAWFPYNTYWDKENLAKFEESGRAAGLFDEPVKRLYPKPTKR